MLVHLQIDEIDIRTDGVSPEALLHPLSLDPGMEAQAVGDKDASPPLTGNVLPHGEALFVTASLNAQLVTWKINEKSVDLITYFLPDEGIGEVILDDPLVGFSAGVTDVHFELDHSVSLLLAKAGRILNFSFPHDIIE